MRARLPLLSVVVALAGAAACGSPGEGPPEGAHASAGRDPGRPLPAVGLPPSMSFNPFIPTYVENASPLVIDSAANVTDVDSPDFFGGSLTVTLSLNGVASDRLAVRNEGTGAGQIGVAAPPIVTFGTAAIGTFSGGDAVVNPLVITFSEPGQPSVAAARALARNITFETISDDPSVVDRTARFVINDGDGNDSAAVFTAIHVEAVNDAPALVLTTGGAFGYTENGTAAPIAGAATLGDPDSTNFDGGTLTVEYSAGGSADDQLAIRNEGSGAGQIGASGGIVSFEGIAIGTFSGGSGTTPLVVNLLSTATPAAAQALVRNVTFENQDDTPDTSPRTVRFTMSDGDGGTTIVTRDLTVTAVNDPPVLTLPGFPINYVAQQPAKIIDATATISDVDSSLYDAGTLTVDFALNGVSTDRLDIRDLGTGTGQIDTTGTTVRYEGVSIGTFTGGNGTAPLVITFDADATIAAVQALLRNITFRNTNASPSTLARSVRFVITESGGAPSVAVTQSVNVAAASPPTFSNLGTSRTYQENTLNTVGERLDDNATAANTGGTGFFTGSLTLSLQSPTVDDGLEIRNTGTTTISGSTVFESGVAFGTVSGGTAGSDLVIVFDTTAATDAAISALLRAIYFTNADNTPPGGNRDITWTLIDADGESVAQDMNITIDANNDGPVTVPDAYSVAEDSTLTVADPGVLDNDSDLEGDPFEAFVDTQPANGTVSIGVGGGFTYDPVPDFTGTDTFTYIATDDKGASSVATLVTVTVTPVNDTPIAVADAVIVGEDAQIVSAVLANDVALGDTPLVVTITTAAAFGVATPGTNGTVTYTPDPNYNGPDDYTYRVTDVDGQFSAAFVAVTVNSANDPVTVSIDGQTPDPGAEGGSTSIIFTVAEPVDGTGGPYSVDVDFGDGNSATGSLSGPGTANFAHVWVGDGAFPISVTVNDGALQTTANGTVTIDNVAPSALDLATNDPVPEGDAVALTVSWFDPGLDTFTVELDWGDGTPVETFNVLGTDPRLVGRSHFYADAGSHSVRVDVTDADGAAETAFATVVISDRPPVVSSVLSNGPRVEGSPITVDVLIEGPGGDAVSYVFTPAPASQSGSQATFVLDDEGTLAVQVAVTDDEGNVASGGASLLWTNGAPSIVSAIPTGAIEGGLASIAVTATDPSASDAAALLVEFDWDGDGTFGEAGENVASHVFATDGSYLVRVRVTDDGGLRAETTVVVVVTDAPPEISAVTAPATALEGAAVSISVTASDPSGDPLTYLFDFENDGSVDVSGPSPFVTHVYPQDGSFDVAIVVADDRGNVDSFIGTIAVANVAPVLTASIDAAPEGQASVLHVSATDAGADALSFEVNWGDGSPLEPVTGGLATHVYADDGTYDAVAVVFDDDDSTSVTIPVVVADVAPSIIANADDGPGPEGGAVTLTVVAAAAATDALSYTWFPAPVTSTGGTASWTRPDDGVLVVTVTVGDGDSQVAVLNATLRWDNVAPVAVVASGCGSSADGIGGAYACDLDAADPAGADDTLRFTLASGPVGMSLNPVSGVIAWTPAADQTRSPHPFLARVFDEDGGSTLFTRTVTTYLDGDGDGMSDAWESANGTNPAVDDASDDPDGDGRTNLEEFTVGEDPGSFNGPAAPETLAPLDGLELSTVTPVLRWANVAHAPTVAITYVVEIFPDVTLVGTPVATFSAIPEDSAQLPGGITYTEITASGLADDTAYAWRVRASDGLSAGESSLPEPFFLNTANDTPGAPTASSPEDGAEVPQLAPMLEVANAPDSDRDALTYVFEIAIDPGFVGIAATSPPIAEGSGLTRWNANLELEDNVTYHWRVRATDPDAAAGPFSVTRSFFVNTADNAPTAALPASPAVGVEIATDAPTLVVANATDLDGDTLSYQFQVANNPAFAGALDSGLIAEDPSGSTSHGFAGLAENTTHWWRARASDGPLFGDWSASSFYVNVANEAPSAPVTQNPGSGSVVETKSVVLSLLPASDPEGDPLTYSFTVYESDLSTGVFDEISGIAPGPNGEARWKPARSFDSGQIYLWAARATDDGGLTGPDSPPTEFRTLTAVSAGGCGCALDGRPAGATRFSGAVIAALGMFLWTRRRKRG